MNELMKQNITLSDIFKLAAPVAVISALAAGYTSIKDDVKYLRRDADDQASVMAEIRAELMSASRDRFTGADADRLEKDFERKITALDQQVNEIIRSMYATVEDVRRVETKVDAFLEAE